MLGRGFGGLVSQNRFGVPAEILAGEGVVEGEFRGDFAEFIGVQGKPRSEHIPYFGDDFGDAKGRIIKFESKTLLIIKKLFRN